MKTYTHNGLAGCVSQRRNHDTGSVVGIYRADQADLDPDGGPWVTVCENHGRLVNHRTLALARAAAPYSSDWCDLCQQRQRGHGHAHDQIEPQHVRDPHAEVQVLPYPAAYVDGHGHLYCHACALDLDLDLRHPETRPVYRDSEPHASEPCDRCQRIVREVRR